jgi:hypothetical protein
MINLANFPLTFFCNSHIEFRIFIANCIKKKNHFHTLIFIYWLVYFIQCFISCVRSFIHPENNIQQNRTLHARQQLQIPCSRIITVDFIDLVLYLYIYILTHIVFQEITGPKLIAINALFNGAQAERQCIIGLLFVFAWTIRQACIARKAHFVFCTSGLRQRGREPCVYNQLQVV